MIYLVNRFRSVFHVKPENVKLGTCQMSCDLSVHICWHLSCLFRKYFQYLWPGWPHRVTFVMITGTTEFADLLYTFLVKAQPVAVASISRKISQVDAFHKPTDFLHLAFHVPLLPLSAAVLHEPLFVLPPNTSSLCCV